MSVRISRKVKAIPLALVALLLAAGCAQPAHPDRAATEADVEAGTACKLAPVMAPVWKETDREYIGENGVCKYRVK